MSINLLRSPSHPRAVLVADREPLDALVAEDDAE